MKKNPKAYIYALASCLIVFIVSCVYPTVFIQWIVPLYAVCVVGYIAAAVLLFSALFTAGQKEKPLLKACIGGAAFAAVLMTVTPLVNNGIFGAVAPWGSVLTNTVLLLAFWLIMLRLIRKAAGEPFVWRPLVCAALVLAGLTVGAVTTVPNIKATGFVVMDTPKNYEAQIGTIDIYQNTLADAVPQTRVHGIITAHLASPLPEGKTEKKVLVLGWDGCRADAMTLKEHREAVDALLAGGGKAMIAYCGGANYPAPITQDTSTAPGWCSILTGLWAETNGITANGGEKTTEHPSLLLSGIEDGYFDSTAFYFSWDGHLQTYKNEIAYAAEKGLNARWVYTEGDEATYGQALADLQQADCTDFIFTVFEYCDKYGHEYGFWNDAPEYAAAFASSNEKGLALIEAVRARPTYETEDWLILITSDHGGYARGHGGETLMERMMFIVTGS